MLPEALSNNLCSLRENEEKLAFSTIFTMTPNGEILDTWYGRTIIKSNKRFTYMEAQDIMDAEEGLFVKELTHLNTIAKMYRETRIEEGALTLEKEELRFILDAETGKPIEIRKKSRKDVHKMIEEWMLLANRSVATYLSEKTNRSFMVYRIHEKPDPRKVFDLRNFLLSLGYEVRIKEGVIPSKELDRIVAAAKSDDERDIISLNIARSMAKAVYSLENIGHYGLGFTFYTHFTSPIRRYTDLLAHFQIKAHLRGDPLPFSVERMTELTQGVSSGACEAVTVERQTKKYWALRWVRFSQCDILSIRLPFVQFFEMFDRKT